MLKLIKENKVTWLVLTAIILLYFGLRLPNLTLQPIFADEAIYIRWAQVMRADQTLRFLPLIDGKTPLFMWLLIPLFKFFSDPLLTGRLLSVFSGFFTLLGVLFLGWRFFGRRVGLLAAFLICIVPYILFFDRMALVDSMLSAFTIWSVNFALLLATNLRLDLAMFLGYFLGGAILTKTAGMFNLLTLPFSILAFDFSRRQKDKWTLLKFLGLMMTAIIIGLLMYNTLRLGPNFQNLSSRNQDYLRSPQIILQNPLDPFVPHSLGFFDFAIHLLTWPIILLTIWGILLVVMRRQRVGWVILLWAFIPWLAQTIFLQTYTARYLLFSIPLLLVLASFGLDNLISKIKLKNNLNTAFAIILISILPLSFAFHLLTKPEDAPLPKDEHIGYFEDWTAGYGFAKIAKYLDNESKKAQVVVGTEGFFGTLPDGLQIYLDKNRNVVVIGGRATVSADLRTAAKDHPTFFVANKSRYPFYESDLELIKEYPKPTSTNKPADAILFFKVLPKH